MTDPVYYELDERLLEKAKMITLSDLLSNPASQCWMMSCLGNSLSYAHIFESAMEPNDSHQLFIMNGLFRDIPMDERQQLFEQTSRLIRTRKKEKND